MNIIKLLDTFEEMWLAYFFFVVVVVKAKVINKSIVLSLVLLQTGRIKASCMN